MVYEWYQFQTMWQTIKATGRRHNFSCHNYLAAMEFATVWSACQLIVKGFQSQANYFKMKPADSAASQTASLYLCWIVSSESLKFSNLCEYGLTTRKTDTFLYRMQDKSNHTLPRIVLMGSSSTPYPGASRLHCLIVLSSPICHKKP